MSVFFENGAGSGFTALNRKSLLSAHLDRIAAYVFHTTLRAMLLRVVLFDYSSLQFWQCNNCKPPRPQCCAPRGRVLPIVDYTGRRCPKGVPFKGWR